MGELHDVVGVRVVGDWQLHLTFDDGTAGVVDLSDLASRSGVFAPLRDTARFAEVRVDPEAGTIVWPGGADLDPCGLYDDVKATARATA